MEVRSNMTFSGGALISGLPSSTANGQAVVHEQLTSALLGLAWKDDVRVSTQANIDLSAPGATIDGITMVANDRFIARSQTSALENGIYVWNGAAVAATRATDSSTFNGLEGAVTVVTEGTNAGTSYRQTQVNGTIETDTITWTTFGASSGAASETSAGVAELATQAETDAGTDDARIVTPLKLATSPFARKQYTALFGDGSATSFTITHSLSEKYPQVTIVKESTGAEIGCDITYTNNTTMTVGGFVTAPTSNELRVIALK